MRLKPIALMTMGGIKVNGKLQVVDVYDNPIPGLYAAGECVGGVWGKYPSSGTGVTGAITFGKIAGENVVKLPVPEYETDPNVMPSFGIEVDSETPVSKKAEAASAVTTKDFAGLQDGTYTGAGKGMNGEIEVSVTVLDGTVTEITVTAHEETPGVCDPALEKIPVRIIDSQSLAVDTVTGATFTSNGLIEAVDNALQKAKK